MPILATNVIENAFSPLITAFESVMVFIHNNLVGGSWGLAIIGLTVLIRAVLVPLTFRQLKSMQEMQRLAPQISALKEKYKDDKQRQQQEVMKFYQANKINPLASCLPLLMQIPVFISLFYMLRTDLKLDICGRQLREYYSNELGRHLVRNSEIPEKALTGIKGNHLKSLSDITCSQVPGAQHAAKFLFLPDITMKATGAALIVLIVLYVGSQVASTLMATATADANQRRLMLLLPLVFIFILYRYPAGLLVYWITTNMWTIIQQAVIRRYMGPAPPTPAAAATTSNGKAGGLLKPLLAAAGGGGGGRSAGGGGGAGKGAAKDAAKGAGNDLAKSAPASAPRPPPRKKKKRSGRRR